MMKCTPLFFLLAACLACQPTSNQEAKETDTPAEYPTIGSIERLDPALDAILSPDAIIEILAEGFEWSEGPVWVPSLQGLLFSDIPPNTVYLWKEGEGHTPFLKPSGYTGESPRGGEVGSNGLLLDPNGNLVLCQHGDRRIARMDASWDDPQPVYTTVVDTYDGKRFNSPNDAAYASNGDLYFTDPPYGLEQNIHDPLKELPFQGVYRYGADGALTLLTDSLTRPNGIGLSPDQSTLYVANSDPAKAVWYAFDLNPDGNLANGRIFFDATDAQSESRKGLPDGLKVKRDGHIFATGPGGVWIFSPEGQHLGTILTTEATANCAFDPEEQFLYMTADMYVLRVKLQ